MSSIDNEVVSLTFDNSQFERGIADTLKSLETLTANLEQFNDNTGFRQLQADADSVNLSNISDRVDQLTDKFDVMGAVAFSAIQKITGGALDAGRSLVENLLDPIIGKGRQRALAIEQAKFLFEGLGQDVQKSMASALDAVRGTAYGLDEAATLASIFGAAGVTAGDELTGALRGVAGVAAITGRGFGEIGGVFQNIASLNRVYTNDLNSLALRGLGFETIAKAMGMTVEDLRKAAADGSIDFRTFAAAMNEAFGDHAVEANKTYTGSLSNLRAALSRIGADVYVGRFEALRRIFNALAPAIDRIHEAIQPVIQAFGWFAITRADKIAKFLDGLDFSKLAQIMTHIPKIFQNVFRALKSFIAPIKDAFQDIFPDNGFRKLEQIVVGIQRFTKHLKISASTGHQVRNIFRGVFSVLSIGWSVLKGVVHVVASFVKALSGGESGTLKFAGGIGKMLMHLKELLVNGGAIKRFFNDVAEKVANFVNAIKNSGVVQAFSNALKDLGHWLGTIFGDDSSVDIDKVGDSFGRVGDRIESLNFAGDKLSGVWDTIKSGFQTLGDFLMGYIDRVKEAFSGWWESLKESFSKGNFNKMGDLVNTGLIAVLTSIFWKLTHGGIDFNLLGGVTEQIETILGSLTDTLKAMQMEIRARALFKIAEGVALLTVSAVALSLVDSAALGKALAAMSIGMAQMVGVMAALNSLIGGPTDAFKLQTLGVALVSMALGMLIFAGAVALMGSMKLETIAKGLAGIAGSFVVLGTAAYLMEGMSLTITTLGLSLIPMAIGLGLVAGALAIFSTINTNTVAESLLKMAAALAVLGAGAWLLEEVIPQMALLGVALIPLAIGLAAVGGAIAIFGVIGLENVATGLLGIVGALAIFGAAALLLSNVTPMISLLGLSLIPLALGLMAIAAPIAIFNQIGLEGVATGLLGIAGALAIIGAASLLLSQVTPMIALLGAALVPMAIGLGMIGSVVMTFAAMDMNKLGVGLLGIAASLAVLGVAATLMSESIPFIAALGAALILVAGAFALFGAGVYLIAEAFKVTAEGMREIARLGPEAWDSIINGLKHAVTFVPQLLSQLAEGILAFLDTFLSGLPNSIKPLWDILEMLLDQFLSVVIEYAPKVGEALIVIGQTIISVFNELSPQLITAGLQLLINLLEGIRANIWQITTLVSEIILSFLTALTEKVPQLVNAGINFLLAFLGGIATRIASVVSAAYGIVIAFINGIAANIGGVVTAAVNLIVSFLNGIANNVGRIVDAGGDIIIKFIKGIGNKALDIANAAADTVVKFTRGLAKSIREHSGEMEDAAAEVGDAIIDGVVHALTRGKDAVVNKLRNIAGNALDAVTGFLGINSPSRVFMEVGEQVIAGFVIGLDHAEPVISSAETLAKNVVSQFTQVTNMIGQELDNIGAINPTIAPVLDLTGVTRDARQLSSILGASPITASVSSGRAMSIARDNAGSSNSVTQEVPVQTGPKEITFQQINYARDELTLDELYVQTRSQIAMAKKELGI